MKHHTLGRLFCLFAILFPAFVQAENYQVKLHISNLPANSRPLLLRIYNGNMLILDSLPVKENDSTIIFNIPGETAPGQLRALLGMPAYTQYTNKQPVMLNFLFNRENVELKFGYQQPETNVEVIQSEENRIYFQFLKEDAIILRKLGLIEQVVINYPEQDEFLTKAQEHYKKLQQQRNKSIDKAYSANRNTLAGRIISNQKFPLTDHATTLAERTKLFQEHFLDNVEFNDTTLLYTSIYTDKIFQYIQMSMKREATPRENEAYAIQALDKIIPRLAANQVIQQHLLQFLIEGFEAMKMEEVLAHISNNYLQQCGSNSDIVKRRLEGYRKMAIGQKIPDFTVMDINNTPINLYANVDPYTLLIFWHTECAHCQQMISQLPALMSEEFFKKHQVKVIGISIDENRANWEKQAATQPLDWVNTHVEGSFDSEIASNYNLFATPTLFLVDANHTIIAKPLTIEELKKNILAL